MANRICKQLEQYALPRRPTPSLSEAQGQPVFKFAAVASLEAHRDLRPARGERPEGTSCPADLYPAFVENPVQRDSGAEKQHAVSGKFASI
jgi:hypothetical protein